MTIENATPTTATSDADRDVLDAWMRERRPTRHRLGDRPGTEVPASRMAGAHLRRPVVPPPRLVPAPAPSLLARLLRGAR
jgi:hypothetical protein